MKYPVLHHPNCQVSDCRLCLEDHFELGKFLDYLTSTKNRVDHLGKIHKWMSDNGKKPETIWGWATPETFEKRNIDEYVKWYLGIEESE